MTLSTGILTGKKIFLDVITDEDISVMLPWYRDMDFMRRLSRTQPRLSREQDLRNWMLGDRDWREEAPYAIRLLSDNQLIGICSFKDVVDQARHCLLWIGIGDPAMRGKGYGSDALRVMLRFAFLDMNMQRVGLEVGDFNVEAIASYEKVGFVREGTLRNYIFRDGRYWDMHMMSVLRNEWTPDES